MSLECETRDWNLMKFKEIIRNSKGINEKAH